MAEAGEDPGGSVARAMTVLTTEHAALQTARSATVFEANGRVQLYLGALSSGVVALAFVGQAAGLEGAFFTFGLATLLPVLAVGVVTFARVQQSAVEDLGYSRRIERIRRFYVEHAPLAAGSLARPADGGLSEAVGALGGRPGRWQVALTTAGMVGVVNAAVAGVAAAMVLGLLGAGFAPSGLAAAAVALLAVVAHYRYQERVWAAAERAAQADVGNRGSGS